jgi:hypothetical protein
MARAVGSKCLLERVNIDRKKSRTVEYHHHLSLSVLQTIYYAKGSLEEFAQVSAVVLGDDPSQFRKRLKWELPEKAPLHVFVVHQLARIRLPKPFFHFGNEIQAFHGLFNRRIHRELFRSIQHAVLCRFSGHLLLLVHRKMDP